MASSTAAVLGWLLPALYLSAVVGALAWCGWNDLAVHEPTWNSPGHFLAVLVTLPTSLLTMLLMPLREGAVHPFYASVGLAGLINAAGLAGLCRWLLPG
jgi:hypothetical protein